MATVIGKTSDRINQLLAELITTASIVDGHLILKRKDGGQIDAGSVGGATSIMRVFYTSGAWPSRPTGALCVEWVGPTLPPQMTDKDSWVSTA